MAGQTSKFKLPYVDPGDVVVSYPATSKDLAQKLEAALVGAYTADSWTAQTGWAISGQYSYKQGQLIWYYLTGTRTGAQLTVDAGTGAITGGAQPIAQLNATTFPVTAFGVASSGGARPLNFALQQTGQLQLVAAAGTAVIATGAAWACRGVSVLA